MQKKILILFFTIIAIISLNIFKNVEAEQVVSDYNLFSSITPSSGKLLSKYTDKELTPYAKATKKRRFAGWRISYINKRVKCNFISETILSVYNSGTSVVKYNVTQINTTVYKTTVSATAKIGYNLKGKGQKNFSHDLDAELKIEGTHSETIEVKTTENMSIEVEPKTKLLIYLAGTGYLTNGYARRYCFWVNCNYGGFEYFEITDIYPKIVMVSL